MRLSMLIFLSLFAIGLHASDVAKEQRWASQIVDFLIDGEAEWLQAEGHEFLAIYTEAQEESSKGMIVVHGTGIHPNWDQVVRPVRVEMTAHGWNTLSIQMPILPNEATYEEYVPLYPEVPPRLQAAEDFLISQGIKDIVIVAHSQGATMSAYYLSRHDHQVRGFVAIGMQASQPDPAINAANSLKLIRIPVLDLYGSEDLAEVLNTIQLRKDAAAQNTGYKQKMVKGADHFFVTKNTPLIETIDEWLNSANLF